MRFLILLILTACSALSETGDPNWYPYPAPIDAPAGSQCWDHRYRHEIICHFPSEAK